MSGPSAISVQHRPMSVLYEVLQRFTSNGTDSTAFDDFEYQMSQYHTPPSRDPNRIWSPHLLDLHPPPSNEAQTHAKNIISVSSGGDEGGSDVIGEGS
jgi:hypothetical protein